MSGTEKGRFALVANSAVVGLLPIIARARPNSLDSSLFACFTLLFEGIFLLPLVPAHPPRRGRVVRDKTRGTSLWRQWPRLLLLSAIFSLASIVMFLGMDLASSAVNASLILKTDLVFSLFAGHLIYHERLRGKQVFFASLVFVGLFVAISQGSPENFAATDLVLLAVPALWLAGNMITKKMLTESRVNPVHLACIRAFLGAAVAIPVYTAITGSFGVWVLLDPLDFAFVLGNAAGYLAAHLAWNYGIQRQELSKAYQFKATSPVFTALLSWLVLGEGLTPYHLAGFGIVVIASLALVWEAGPAPQKEALLEGVEPAVLKLIRVELRVDRVPPSSVVEGALHISVIVATITLVRGRGFSCVSARAVRMSWWIIWTGSARRLVSPPVPHPQVPPVTARLPAPVPVAGGRDPGRGSCASGGIGRASSGQPYPREGPTVPRSVQGRVPTQYSASRRDRRKERGN
ncbi:MAG: DMT family transporter [Promethearchaeota archaeon]